MWTRRRGVLERTARADVGVTRAVLWGVICGRARCATQLGRVCVVLKLLCVVEALMCCGFRSMCCELTRLWFGRLGRSRGRLRDFGFVSHAVRWKCSFRYSFHHESRSICCPCNAACAEEKKFASVSAQKV